jgi:dihydropteroate synthase
MGILNVTPDSFSDGGAFVKPQAAVRRGIELAAEGADVIDIGGESTRPGARGVSLNEELRRTLPVIERLAVAVSIPLSIDTTKAEVAAKAIRAGASIVNDISALRADPRMPEIVAAGGAAVILMHMRGTPQTMQQAPRYHDVVGEVVSFLAAAAARARQQGIDARRILIDPGLGFGKTVRHNLELMRSLKRLGTLGYPVVIGPSRKSFIGKTVHADVTERLGGTLGCVAAAMQQGVHMVRVHDVRETIQCLRMLEAIERGS